MSTEAGAAAEPLVVVTESPIENVVVLEMNGGKANVLTTGLISALLSTIREVCDPDKGKCRGIVLTSKNPGVYSAGLDLNELSTDLTEERFANYWNQFQQLFVTLHSLPVPFVSAINGHAAAAGCIIALASDYRVMARSHHAKKSQLSIGISAARYGFVVPPYVAGSMELVIGFRRAEEMLQLGTMLDADAAQKYGLVDEVVDDVDEAVVPSLCFIQEILSLPSPLPYWTVKNVMRRRVLAPLCTHALRAQDTSNFYEILTRPSVKAALAEHARRIVRK